MKHAVMAGALLGLLALAVAGCGGKSASSSSRSGGGGGGGQTVVGGVKANNHGSKTVSSSAEVELDDYYFEPTVIQGKAGSTVTLELKNQGSVEHNFSIDGQTIDKDLEPGDSAKVTVTIPKSGSISFYCKYHKSMGMAGALEVGGTGGMTGGGETTTEETTTEETTTGKGY